MSERELIKEFKSIACDEALTDQEILTYLQWAKNKVDVALNYYFNRIQKKVDKAPKSKPPSKAEIKLKEGAEKEKKTEDYIKNLKKQYNLPLKMRAASESVVTSEYADIDYIPNYLNTHPFDDQMPQPMDEEPIVHSKPKNKQTALNKRELKMEVEKKQKRKSEPKQEEQRKIPSAPVSQSISKPAARSTQQISQVSNLSDIYIGQLILNCFSTASQHLPGCKEEDPVSINIYNLNKTDPTKTKKSTKRAEDRMMMKIVWANKEIGRVEDDEAKIIYAIMNTHIKMEMSLVTRMSVLSHFTPFNVKAKVYIRRQAISKPIVETFENQADSDVLKACASVRQNFIALFNRLGLVICRLPLIKLMSKYKAANNQNKIKVQEVVPVKEPKGKTLAEIHHDKVNNPFRVEKQVNLQEMFSKKSIGQKTTEDLKMEVQEKPQFKEVQIKADAYTQLIDLHEQDLEEAQPSNIFLTKLHQYQSLALSWMLRREGVDSQQEELTMHPMWMQYQTPNNESLFFNEFTGQLSTEAPMFRCKCKGGILADEMGLGKTVMLIALMATNRPATKHGKNLIILPLTLLEQWDNQISVHTKHRSLKVLKYYEPKDRNADITSYDIVLTTYGIISQQFSMGYHISNQGLYRHNWFRVILDEAHYIKGRVIQIAKAVYNLRCQISWCLTGTPIQNKLQDLFSLIHFIKYTPWSDYNWWNNYINKPHEAGDPVVFEVLTTILKKVMLRRTKQSKKANGQPIIKLPEKVSKIVYITLSQKEREFYDAVYEASKKEFDELDSKNIVEAKYMKIFEILMRLRQICCHPVLFKSVTKFSSQGTFSDDLRKWLKKRIEQRNSVQKHSRYELLMEDNQEVCVEIKNLQYNQKHFDEVVRRVQDSSNPMCSVCLDNLSFPVITVCLHTYCKSCLVATIQTIGYCPECRTILSKEDYMSLPRENRVGISFSNDFRPSTKMDILMRHLKGLQKQEKAVVFSQFLGMIDLVQEHMKRQKISYVRMDGSVSQKDRVTVIDKFKNDPSCQVFIISLKSGGVGLNLVVANKVFMVDPWWNPAVEEQAIERVHRIGQKRKVEVFRFIVQNSIESRMIKLHERKQEVSNLAISQKESKENKIEEFRYLLSRY